MSLHRSRLRLAVVAWALLTACAAPEPSRQFVLQGQILEVQHDRLALTIRHDAIPGFMGAMTMTFPVAERRLMEGRTPGETITATLEVTNAVGRLVSITHTGSAPLPTADTAAAAGRPLAVGDLIPDAALIDLRNDRRSLSAWRGTALVLTWLPSRCPSEICRQLAARFLALHAAIVASPTLRSRVRVVAITTDPTHDTPDALAVHAASLGLSPDVCTWLTGDLVTVRRLAGRFGIALPADGTAPSPWPPVTVVSDPEGRITAIHHEAGWSAAALLRELGAPAGARQ